MTKIKNTKKGMAKKTLSMSLVVAMLATSNVPVWAAEFSDGSDAAVATEAPVAETFSDDAAEAPVVENNSDAEVATADAITENDIDVSGIKLKVGTDEVNGKDVPFLSKVTVEGSILKKDGTALQDYGYGWRIVGESAAIETGTVSGGNVASMEALLSSAAWKEAVGKTVELYIFRNDDAAKIANKRIATINVTAQERTGTVTLTTVNGASISKDSEGNYIVPYNGKAYTYGTVSDSNVNNLVISKIVLTGGVTTTLTGKAITDNYDISVLNPATNAGDVLTIKATPKADSAYAGDFSADVKVVAKSYADGDLVAELKAPLEYEYTGKDITVPTDKFIVKEKSGAYADATLGEDVIIKATTDGDYIGEDADTEVVLSNKNVKNFDFGTDKKTINVTGANDITIKKRDLKNVVVSLGFANPSTNESVSLDSVPEGTTAENVDNYLVFKDKDGNVLNLNSNDYTIKVTERGKSEQITGTLSSQKYYTVTITANRDAGTCSNATTLDFSVYGDAVINHATSESLFNKNYYYTGNAIEPSKDDIGDIDIYGIAGSSKNQQGPKLGTVGSDFYEIVKYNNNTDATVWKDNDPNTDTIVKTASVTVKITDGQFKGNTVDVIFFITPLAISANSVTVPETVSINENYKEAKEYNIPLTVTAKDPSGKIVKTLSTSDFAVKYRYQNGTNSKDTVNAKNEIHDFIQSIITSKNSNYVCVDSNSNMIEKLEMPASKYTEIVAKALTDGMVKVNPSSYTYTGANIIPDFVVMDGTTVLYDKAEYGSLGEYEVAGYENNLNVGTAKVTVKGANDLYSGKATGTFQITPANTSDVKVQVKDQAYTGRQVRPRMDQIKVTLNGNDVTDQFELTGDYGANVSNKGTLTLKAKDTTKNFTGSNVTVDFNIVSEVVGGTLFAYNTNGVDVTDSYKANKANGNLSLPTEAFDFDGTEKTFKTIKLKELTKIKGGLAGLTTTKATADDFEIKYADNVSGKKTDFVDSKGNHYNIAYVYAVAKDGTGFAGEKEITLADGSKITGVVDYIAFAIRNVEFVDKNVTVSNGVYAGGLQVKPQVLVQINGNTLVEGKDYELVLKGATTDNHYTDVTNTKLFTVQVKGKGGYTGSLTTEFKWGIDKKDLKDCDVKVTNGVTTVMNGYIPVPTTEYTSVNNGNGTYTVTANSASKSYVGSVKVKADGKAENEKPDAPMISSVKVVGNKATAILSGDSEGAAGYDYVISTDRDCITNKDYDSVNKNQVQTSTTFKYVQQGTYYAYCHAWKRDANGKKVFSDWSNAYPFVVSAITPDAPVITNVTVSGSTIKVTYKAAANATGYDVVLGTGSKKENGETRPYQYGNHKKLNLKEGTVTATFKNVPKGTWVVGMHAFNRTSEDGKKVFSPWSNLKKATVK